MSTNLGAAGRNASLNLRQIGLASGYLPQPPGKMSFAQPRNLAGKTLQRPHVYRVAPFTVSLCDPSRFGSPSERHTGPHRAD
jgi:hypothetical protein